jgi:hypothetical protein
MKNLLMISVLLSGAGCAARSADMYARDTGAVLATKNDAITACYNGVLKTTPTAQGTVTVKFDVETKAGAITNVAVDPSSTAPPPVASCVTQNLTGLSLNPPDSRKGQGTWVYQFGPAGAVAATPPPPPSTPPPSSGGASISVTVGPKT